MYLFIKRACYTARLIPGFNLKKYLLKTQTMVFIQ